MASPRPFMRSVVRYPKWSGGTSLLRVTKEVAEAISIDLGLKGVAGIALAIAELVEQAKDEKRASKALAARAWSLATDLQTYMISQNGQGQENPTLQQFIGEMRRTQIAMQGLMHSTLWDGIIHSSRNSEVLNEHFDRLDDAWKAFTIKSLLQVQALQQNQQLFDGELLRESQIRVTSEVTSIGPEGELEQALAEIIGAGREQVVIRRLRKTSHPNVVQLLGYSPQSSQYPFYVLYPAFCTKDATAYIQSKVGVVRFKEAIAITRQTRNAAEYLWNKGISWGYDGMASVKVHSDGIVLVGPEAFNDLDSDFHPGVNPIWKIGGVYHNLMDSAVELSNRPFGYGPQDLSTYGVYLDALNTVLQESSIDSCKCEDSISSAYSRIIDAWQHVYKQRSMSYRLLTPELGPHPGDIGYWKVSPEHGPPTLSDAETCSLPPLNAKEGVLRLRDGIMRYAFEMDGVSGKDAIWLVGSIREQIKDISVVFRVLIERGWEIAKRCGLQPHELVISKLTFLLDDSWVGNRMNHVFEVTGNSLLIKASAELEANCTSKKYLFFYRPPIEAGRLPPKDKPWGYWSLSSLPTHTRSPAGDICVGQASLKGVITNVYVSRPRTHYLQLTRFEADVVRELSKVQDATNILTVPPRKCTLRFNLQSMTVISGSTFLSFRLEHV
ncbi:hypothetical protein EW146_g5018 [Bondarzewia mesenterica]|uniref:Protein kinase domain-containing protein n=1 Tax=Bondarzewia mesenterica TaxID=1095465 RepID=A0A4S4LSQ3_9AGAM|nr:hypothetical protein EW146_g5018 [Bondarzewia mesenterica]